MPSRGISTVAVRQQFYLDELVQQIKTPDDVDRFFDTHRWRWGAPDPRCPFWTEAQWRLFVIKTILNHNGTVTERSLMKTSLALVPTGLDQFYFKDKEHISDVYSVADLGKVLDELNLTSHFTELARQAAKDDTMKNEQVNPKDTDEPKLVLTWAELRESIQTQDQVKQYMKRHGLSGQPFVAKDLPTPQLCQLYVLQSVLEHGGNVMDGYHLLIGGKGHWAGQFQIRAGSVTGKPHPISELRKVLAALPNTSPFYGLASQLNNEPMDQFDERVTPPMSFKDDNRLLNSINLEVEYDHTNTVQITAPMDEAVRLAHTYAQHTGGIITALRLVTRFPEFVNGAWEPQ
jgi:hypothetical protein